MKSSLLTYILILIQILDGAKTPYVSVDFNQVHLNGQPLSNDVHLDNEHSTSTTTDNNGNTVGVFECAANDKFKRKIAYIFSGVTSSAFSLEVIVKIRSFDTLFNGFIIGIFDTSDNIQGNAISFNENNRFFATNKEQNGWKAGDAYFSSTNLIEDLSLNEFYHVIISQNTNGIVTVYVNGAKYGDSYSAPGGKKVNGQIFASIYICGDLDGNVGIDASIRAFGFYSESFDSETDVKDSCIAAGLTDCNGIPRRTTLSPTSDPTPSPVEPCVYGENYWIHGINAVVSGDPHYNTFNGEYHDFQGRPGQQVYYMHPCPGKTRKQMPFSILGRHWQVGTSSITGLDYITFELYDENGDIYYIWLSTSIQNYRKADITTSSLYDRNPGTNFASNQQIVLGKRFKFKYIKSSTTVYFTLTIRDDCTVTGYMRGQRVDAGRWRMHYLLIRPPQCYKCYTCGLLGGFARAPLAGTLGIIRRCDAGIQRFIDNDYNNRDTYDPRGWSWEKNYFRINCEQKFTNTNRRILQGDDFDIEFDPDFEIIIPCNTQFKSQVNSACETARNSKSQCCTQIGGTFCDTQLESCKFDGCLGVTIDGINTLSDQVNKYLIEPIELLCSIPDISDDFDEDNLVEAPGAPQTTLSPTPSPVSYIGNCPCTVLPSDNACNSDTNKIIIQCTENNLSFDETTDAIRSCIDISSSVIPDDIVIKKLIITTKFDHTYVGDLELYLQHNFVNIQLIANCAGGGCSAHDVDVIFDDENGDNTLKCKENGYCSELSDSTSFGIGGIRKPNNALSSFIGETVNGRYAIIIKDVVGADKGLFGTWSIEISVDHCPSQKNNANSIIEQIEQQPQIKQEPIEQEPIANEYKYKYQIPIDDNNNNNNNFWQIIQINVLLSISVCIFIICICFIIYGFCKYLNNNNYHIKYAGVVDIDQDDKL